MNSSFKITLRRAAVLQNDGAMFRSIFLFCFPSLRVPTHTQTHTKKANYHSQQWLENSPFFWMHADNSIFIFHCHLLVRILLLLLHRARWNNSRILRNFPTERKERCKTSAISFYLFIFFIILLPRELIVPVKVSNKVMTTRAHMTNNGLLALGLVFLTRVEGQKKEKEAWKRAFFLISMQGGKGGWRWEIGINWIWSVLFHVPLWGGDRTISQKHSEC